MSHGTLDPFQKYWAELVRKNPSLASSSKMTISILSFRNELEKAFEAGKEQDDGPFGEIFNRVMGDWCGFQGRGGD